jgi:predicted nucleic acid-binding protein
MNVAIDTSAYSSMQRGNERVAELISAAQYVYVPIIVLAELKAGFAFGSKKSENMQLLSKFLADPAVSVLPITERTTDVFGDIFAELRAAGTPIGQNDLWIASLARENNLLLITSDKDFLSVQGIECVLV